jgi:preprotein translocase subunit Sec63
VVINLAEVDKLLENPQHDHIKLLRILCQLERQYGTIEALLITGKADNIKDFWKNTKVSDLWKITKVADSITNLLIIKLEDLPANNYIKRRSDLLKIIDINSAINNRLELIVKELWSEESSLTD